MPVGYNHPRPSTRQPWKTSTPQSLLKLFRPANSKPAYPALSFPSCRNHNKGSHPCFRLIRSTSWQPLVLPMWSCMAWPVLTSRELWVTNYFFNGCHLLISRPHHTGTILKPTFQNSPMKMYPASKKPYQNIMYPERARPRKWLWAPSWGPYLPARGNCTSCLEQ